MSAAEETPVHLASKISRKKPSNLLLRYAIEIIENGAKKLVPVSTGLYADGYVEINGVGIKEGTEVVVP